jgi:hypothetical protein
MTTHGLRSLLVVVLFLPAAAAPVAARTPAADGPTPALKADRPDAGPAAPVLLADGVSIGKWLSGGRSRVVQVCVVAMCIALFIMMRKLT